MHFYGSVLPPLTWMKAEPSCAGFGQTPMTEFCNGTFFATLACQPDDITETCTESHWWKTVNHVCWPGY